MVSTIPAGSRLLAEDLAEWEGAIDLAMTGGVVIKPSDTSRNNASTGSTFTDDPHLVFPVVANGIYEVEFNANVTIGAGGFKQRFTYPSGTAECGAFDYNNGTVTYTAGWQRITAGASPGMSVAGVAAGGYSGTAWRVTFALFVGVTGGNLVLQWAQDSSNAANTTIVKGSRLRVIRSS